MAQKFLRKIKVTHTYYEVVESTAGRAEFIEKDAKQRWRFEIPKPVTEVVEDWRGLSDAEEIMVQRIEPEIVR